MASLFVFDILQAMGGILDVRWAHRGIVTTGPYCTAQGVIQQIGELGSGLITLILAVHTFVAALWRVGLEARGFALFLVVLVTIFVVLWAGIGSGINENYETPTPYWCWISPSFPGERLGGEYIWLWLALFASALLYIPLYFWTEGRLDVDEKKWYKFRVSNLNQQVEYTQRRAALGMLLYPLAYSFVVLPVSVARWSQFSGKNVPSAATFFRCLDAQSLRRRQCLPTPDRQAPTSPLDPSRPRRAWRTRNRTRSSKSSKHRQRSSLRNRNIPTQSSAEYDCACKRWKRCGRVTCQLES